MKRFTTILTLLVSLMIFGGVLHAEETVLWGKQIAGTGPLSNARTDGNRVTLTQEATISDVEGDAQGYCIWSGGRSVLCGGKGRPDIIGKTLSPGTYTVLPGLNGKSSARISITLK